MSEETVKSHVSRVLTKLHPRDRTQAVVVAYESALVVPRARRTVVTPCRFGQRTAVTAVASLPAPRILRLGSANGM